MSCEWNFTNHTDLACWERQSQCGIPQFGGETEKWREAFDGKEGMGQGLPEASDSLPAFWHYLFEMYAPPNDYATLFSANPLLYLKRHHILFPALGHIFLPVFESIQVEPIHM